MHVILDPTLLREDMARRGLTASELSRRAGVDRATIAKALHGGRVRLSTAHRIGAALADSPVVEMPAFLVVRQLLAAS